MREISTENAPESIGPYSQAIQANGFLFISGQGAVDPDTGEVVGEDIQDETAQTFQNIAAILNAHDGSTDDIVKTNVFVTDINDYEAVNKVYAEWVGDPLPARSVVEVADLPVDISVEIEIIAVAYSDE
jgi:2-iminobutanoate/2-iminopropanoate deaminase